MNSTTFFHGGVERGPSRILHAIETFLAAWADSTAAYRAYRETTRISASQLAKRGLTREDAIRRAVGLPRLPRV